MRILPSAIANRLALPLGVLALLVISRTNPFWLAATWGLVMLLAMLGWGSLVEFLVRPCRPVDLGLRLGWGLAAMLVVGSVGCMLHVASRPFLLGHQLVGCALALALGIRRRIFVQSMPALAFARPAPYVILLVTVGGLALEYLGQLGSTWQEASDDPALYFYFPEKVVQTGTFFEPFAVRRLTTYGGQVYIHALFLAFGRHYQLNVVDCGVGSAIVLALLVGALTRGSIRRIPVVTFCLISFVFLTIRDVRFNVASEMTGLAACLATYRTLLWSIDDRGLSKRDEIGRVAIVACCAVAGCVFRSSNAPALAFFLAGATILRHVRDGARGAMLFRGVRRDLLLLASLGITFLLPWLVMFNESVGTFVYPLSKGNMTPGFTIVKAEPGLAYNLTHILRDVNHDRPFALPKLALAVGLIPSLRGARRVAGADAYLPLLSVVAFLCVCLMSFAGGTFDEAVNSRYYFAFLMWAVFAVLLSVPGERSLGRGGTDLRSSLIVAIAVVHVALSSEEARKRTAAHIGNIERASTNAKEDAEGDELSTMRYRDVQNHVPVGATIVTAVDEPFRFDMRRNRVFSLDQPGAMGPNGHYPVFKGPEAVADYLTANGVRYIVAINFHRSRELFDIDRWRRHLLLQHSFLNYEAPYVVDGLENIEKLAATRQIVYEMFDLRVIDLATRI